MATQIRRDLYADVTSRKRPMRREAREIVKWKLKAQGVKVSLLSAVTITQLANAHLRRNAAELLAAAEASGAVQNLRLAHERRAVDAQAVSACGSPVQMEGPSDPLSNKQGGSAMIVGYARVSTYGQTLDAQQAALAAAVFAEKVSGAVTDRRHGWAMITRQL